MKARRFPVARHSARLLPILSTSILVLSAPWLVAANPDTWNNFTGTNQWSVGTNWLDLSAPLTGDATADLTFGGVSAYVANNDLVGIFLNTLTLNASVAETITGNSLDFRTDDTAATITQSGTGAFTIGNSIVLTNPLVLTGTANAAVSTAVTLNGVISGGGAATFNGGYWQLGNAANTLTAATTVNTGATLELISSGAAPQNLSFVAGATGTLGNSALTINGGTVKLTTKTTGNLNVGRAVTFGTNGGVLDFTNSSGTPGVGGGNIAGGDVGITSNAAGGSVAVVRFNGGQFGLSDNNATSSNLNTGGNTLRFNAVGGAGAIRVELTNGALARAGTGAGGTVTIANPWTYRGVPGGDPTSGITGSPATDGKVNNGVSVTTGRVAIDNANILNFTGGLTFEDAISVGLTGATRAFDGNITIAGTASGHPGYVSFNGRGTGAAAINATLNVPGGSGAGQNPIYIGQGANDTFTVQDGGVAVFDLRVRTDVANNNGVLLNSQAVLNAGGSLRLYQSISSSSTFTSPAGAPNPAAGSVVGNHIIQGNITGQGSTAKESRLDIYLPAAVNLATPGALGGVDFQATSNIVVNGSGFGGLRVSALARPNNLFAGATADPVANDTKINNYLTATRLAALTGSGGYLTPAPNGAVFAFPSGGEWANATPVGLKVVNSNAAGNDVSLGAVTVFNHNVAVDTGATLDTGASAFTFGSTQAMTLAGTGTVGGAGGITIAAGSTIAPGLGSGPINLGTLSVGNLTLNGTYQFEATNAPAGDLLAVVGNLTLGGSSVLSFPVGNTYASADYTVATYTGTLTGTFGSVPSLPVGFVLDYGSLTNGAIKLVFTVPTTIWDGTVDANWDTTTANWQVGATFANGQEVRFDDTATGPNRDIVIGGGNVTPFRVTVNTASAYSITSSAGNALAGAAQLIKNGTGTLTLSGPATYSGGTAINNGTLKLGVSDSLPDSGAVTVGATAILDTQGNSDTVASLSVDGAVNGGGTLTVGSLTLGSGATFTPNLVLIGDVTKNGTNGSTLASNIDLSGVSRTFTVNAGTAPELTLNGVVSNGSLTKAGNGTLVLGNAGNAFAGGVTVNAGTLRIGVAGALPANSPVTINGGTLNANNLALSVPSLSGIGGTLALGSASLSVEQDTNTSFNGAITGGAGSSVTKSLNGILTLGGIGSNYGGGLTINGGTVIASAVGAAGTGTTTVNPGTVFQVGAALSSPITLNGGQLASQGNPAQVTSSSLTVAADSSVLLADSTNPANNSDVAVTGTLIGSGNLIVVAGPNVASADGGPGFRIRGISSGGYSGIITAGPSAKLEVQTGTVNFNPAGTAQFVLTGGTFTTGTTNGNYSVMNIRNNTTGSTLLANNYTITGTGYAMINNPGGAPTGSVNQLGNLNIGDNQSIGVYRNAGNIQSVRFNTVTLAGGTSTFAANPVGFNVSGNANLILGPISETSPANVVLVVGGNNAAIPVTSNLTLAAANTYSGSTTLPFGNIGTVFLGAAGALPSTTALAVHAGTLDFNAAGTSNDQTVASLEGAGGTITNSDTANVRAFTVNQVADTTYSGAIAGALALIKEGPGSLTLSGVNSYSGPTAVNTGTLVVNGSLSGSLTAVNGGVLSGVGTTAALILNGGTLAPGNGPGILNTADLTLAGGTFALEITGNTPGNYDQVNVTGSVSLNSPITLSLDFSTYDPADNTDSFVIVNNDSNDPLALNTFNARFFNGAQQLNEGSIFSVTSGAFTQDFQITYAGGSNSNDVVLHAAPEPSTIGALLGGLGMLTGLQRFRRRK